VYDHIYIEGILTLLAFTADSSLFVSSVVMVRRKTRYRSKCRTHLFRKF